MTKLPYFFLLITLLIAACGDDDGPTIENEEELITELVYVLTPDGGTGTRVQLVFSDPDGDGGQDPIIQVNNPLITGTSYVGTLTVANRSDPSNDLDITAEIRAEDADHQFFFIPSDSLNVTLTYADSDGDGNPLGLETQLLAGAPSTGTLQVILRHEPDKTASGVTISDPAGAGGETDIAVSFPVTVRN